MYNVSYNVISSKLQLCYNSYQMRDWGGRLEELHVPPWIVASNSIIWLSHCFLISDDGGAREVLVLPWLANKSYGFRHIFLHVCSHDLGMICSSVRALVVCSEKVSRDPNTP